MQCKAKHDQRCQSLLSIDDGQHLSRNILANDRLNRDEIDVMDSDNSSKESETLLLPKKQCISVQDILNELCDLLLVPSVGALIRRHI
ncbi:hypothetical protein A6R73_12960 [Xanthomonas translucens pv. poae]|uniref:Uncharacterized protein n=1 Tax=Xanthomonas graminis pv. poae TaxID=227946 RepID=A0A199P678_9XANT|nr:hypothetical protein A6R73_12960 [Xanthomonas translucens pv. poae]